MNIEELKSMKLHGIIIVSNNLHILRVHNGWIYEFDNNSTKYSCIFVPETVDTYNT